MKKALRRRLKTTRTEYAGILYVRVPTLVDESDVNVAAMKARIESAVPDYLARVREWAAKALRAAGLPDTMRRVQRHHDGTWTELPADFQKAIDDLPEGGSIKTTDAATLAAGRELSLEWHAVQLLQSVEALERAVAAGDARRAAAAGIELGGRWQQAIFTERFELNAAIGIAQTGHGSNGGNHGGRPGIANEERAKLQALADELWRKTPSLSADFVATEVKAKSRCSHSARTIRRHLKKPA